ncbi:MAG: hypothetical protein ACR2LK_07690 [Solirubrobacteraceae bacterium]
MELSQLAVALRAECSPAMVGLVDRGYRPHRSAVIERIDRVLSDAEQSTDNDEAPGNRRFVTTSAGVGDGRGEA